MATQRICSVDGCGKPLKASGVCNTHYAQRWRAQQPKCEELGCANAQVSRGLCDSHYRKLLDVEGRKIGRPGEILPCSVDGCRKPHSAFGYCEPHYARFKRHGHPTAGISDRGAGLAFIEEVLARPATNACIEWHRPFRGKGRKSYASVLVNGKHWPAHRYVCFRAHGPEPQPDMETCHSCANKRCINPEHLRWGTEADNGADRSLHGTVCRGVNQWRAKLTDADVRLIRAAPETTSNNELGRRFGVTGENIRFIRKGITWKHVA